MVRAACKPPDVSETSHWRRSRRAGGLQQQAECADYHGGLDAIRSPGRRQQIWHTPGLQDCPWEKKIKKNQADPIYARGDELTVVRHAQTRRCCALKEGFLDLAILAGVDVISSHNSSSGPGKENFIFLSECWLNRLVGLPPSTFVLFGDA